MGLLAFACCLVMDTGAKGGGAGTNVQCLLKGRSWDKVFNGEELGQRCVIIKGGGAGTKVCVY